MQDEMLKTQLERVNAAEIERNISEEQIGVAEDNLKATQDALAPIKEQVDLQKELLDQLIAIARERFGFEEKDKALKGLKGGLSGVSDAADEASDAMKNAGIDADRLAEKLGIDETGEGGVFGKVKLAMLGMFDDVQQRWNDAVGPAVEDLKTTFEQFKTTALFPLMEALGLSAGETPSLAGPYRPPSGRGKGLAGAFAQVSSAVLGVAGTINNQLKEAFGYLKDDGIESIKTGS